MPVVPDMVELYLQNNLLTDLTELPSQPKLRELRLELNDLTSFKVRRVQGAGFVGYDPTAFLSLTSPDGWVSETHAERHGSIFVSKTPERHAIYFRI